MADEKLKAMIMSAGLGSRLEPLTLQVPKPLVTVFNRPVMDILFEKLAEIDVRDVICNTYYLADQIIDRYKNNNFGINFNYIREEQLSGTAGGLKKCQYFFEDGETFIVLSADGLTDTDIQKGIEIHKKSSAIATIGVKHVKKEDVSSYGVVVVDEDGYIVEFQEKPPVEEAKSNLINTGIYIFDYKIFDYIPENTFYDFAKNVFPKLLEKRQINTFKVEGYWNDIGTIPQYIQSTKDVFAKACHFSHGNIVTTESGRYVSKSYVPKSVHFAGDSTIGEGCQIGENVKIENSIIWDNVKIAAGVHLKNCIVASDVSVTKNAENKIIADNSLIPV